MQPSSSIAADNTLLPLEKAVIVSLEQFGAVIAEAAAEHDPSKLAIYIFNVAKHSTRFIPNFPLPMLNRRRSNNCVYNCRNLPRQQ